MVLTYIQWFYNICLFFLKTILLISFTNNAQSAVNNVTTTTNMSLDVRLYNELVEGRILPSEEEGIDNPPPQDESMELGYSFP
ncbi:hypothetical protein F8M41_008121 [Gigaspora margarita]|uniref:Uncharacterized protein n=1 Tax=Gigaspora margarita TaxID=4874 RepID=A0A8H4AVV2_GIGMA|nr:hypothetical protein F8M41_008121 [Gigaspora margarita]